MKPAVIDRLERKAYLGYGVYVGWDPQTEEYVLYTQRQEGEYQFIHLTQDEIDVLNRYTRPR